MNLGRDLAATGPPLSESATECRHKKTRSRCSRRSERKFEKRLYHRFSR